MEPSQHPIQRGSQEIHPPGSTPDNQSHPTESQLDTTANQLAKIVLKNEPKPLTGESLQGRGQAVNAQSNNTTKIMQVISSIPFIGHIVRYFSNKTPDKPASPLSNMPDTPQGQPTIFPNTPQDRPQVIVHKRRQQDFPEEFLKFAQYNPPHNQPQTRAMDSDPVVNDTVSFASQDWLNDQALKEVIGDDPQLNEIGEILLKQRVPSSKIKDNEKVSSALKSVTAELAAYKNADPTGERKNALLMELRKLEHDFLHTPPDYPHASETTFSEVIDAYSKESPPQGFEASNELQVPRSLLQNDPLQAVVGDDPELQKIAETLIKQIISSAEIRAGNVNNKLLSISQRLEQYKEANPTPENKKELLNELNDLGYYNMHNKKDPNVGVAQSLYDSIDFLQGQISPLRKSKDASNIAIDKIIDEDIKETAEIKQALKEMLAKLSPEDKEGILITYRALVSQGGPPFPALTGTINDQILYYNNTLKPEEKTVITSEVRRIQYLEYTQRVGNQGPKATP